MSRTRLDSEIDMLKSHDVRKSGENLMNDNNTHRKAKE